MHSGYRSILVAYDGSDSSQNALEQAVNFANSTGARISAVSALTPPSTWLDPDLRAHMEELRPPSESRPVTEERKAQGYPDIEGIEARTTIYEAIIDAARAKDADLIVMGRRGLNPIERLFVGSTTARVIGYSPIDVLVMPRSAELRWNKALLATDGSRFSGMAAERAINLAEFYGTELKVVHVIDVPAELYASDPGMERRLVESARSVIEPIEHEAKRRNVAIEAFVQSGIASEEILRLTEQLSADLIIVGSHGRTGVERLLMGSVTERIIANSTRPVLVVKSLQGLNG